MALLVIVTDPNVALGSRFSACPKLLGSSIGTEQSEAFNDLKFCSLEQSLAIDSDRTVAVGSPGNDSMSP